MLESSGPKNATNFIFASLLTGVYDVNRNEMLKNNDFGIIKEWYDSILNLQLNALVFHNTFSKDIVEKYTNEHVRFIEVKYDQRLNPNVFRYFVYYDYLNQNSKDIKHLFVTDSTDVAVINNPFESEVYKENSDSLFCGDEPEILANEWMHNHSSHLRNLIPEFSSYEVENQYKTLLTCGVIGGNVTAMKLLLDAMVAVHEAVSFTNTTAYTLDMGVFNFVARTTFAHKIIHGTPVNTIFKKYELHRTDCWFRHK